MAPRKPGKGGGISLHVVDKGLTSLFLRIDRTAPILPSEIGVIGAPDSDTAFIARVHELGLGNAPARSFLRATIDAGRQKYSAMSRAAYGKFLDGTWTLQQAMMSVATEVKADIQARILRGIAPALAPSTVRAKTRAGMPRPRTPLVATTALFNAIRVRLPKWAGGGDAV